MKDISTGKIHITASTVKALGPEFARAGHNIRNLHSEAMVMNAFLDTLSDDASAKLKVEMNRRTTDPEKTTPSR